MKLSFGYVRGGSVSVLVSVVRLSVVISISVMKLISSLMQVGSWLLRSCCAAVVVVVGTYVSECLHREVTLTWLACVVTCLKCRRSGL